MRFEFSQMESHRCKFSIRDRTLNIGVLEVVDMNVAPAFDVRDGPISHADISDKARKSNFATANERDDGIFTNILSRVEIF